MSCVEQTTKKYTSRGSPAYPAQKCPDIVKRGNDGSLYESRPDKNGVYRWQNVDKKFEDAIAKEFSSKSPKKAGRKYRAKSPKKNNNDYNSYTVKELKEMLKSLGLPTTGKKADLITRVKSRELKQDNDIVLIKEYSDYTVVELKDMLKTVHLSTSGKKAAISNP